MRGLSTDFFRRGYANRRIIRIDAKVDPVFHTNDVHDDVDFDTIREEFLLENLFIIPLEFHAFLDVFKEYFLRFDEIIPELSHLHLLVTRTNKRTHFFYFSLLMCI